MNIRKAAHILQSSTNSAFISLKSTTETTEQCVKSVQS